MSDVAARPVAVLGLGEMGSGLAHALLAAGHRVTVHNRTASRADELVAAGAHRAEQAADVAADDVIILSLSDENAVDEVLFGELVHRLKPGTFVIDTSSVSPTFARNTAMRLAASGVRRIEACVVGNPVMARTGQVRIFTAGEAADVDAVRDVLGSLAREVRHIGATGQATALKLALNLLLGAQTVALAETVAFAGSFGLHRDQLLDVIDGGGWQSPVLAFRSRFMRSRQYRPAAFRTSLMVKDLRLIAEEAAARGVSLPLTAAAARRFVDTAAAGRADDDAAAVVEVPAPYAGPTPTAPHTPG